MTKTVQSVFAPVEPKPKKKKSRRNPLYEPQDPVKSVHILSMGAGVQTTAMLLKYGKTGRYDYIVFADTAVKCPAPTSISKNISSRMRQSAASRG